MFFFLLIGFVGDSSLWQRVMNYRRMIALENEIKRYTEEYENDTKQLKLLQENPDNMERIARERYLMKKPNEDIFVFEEDLPEAPIVVAEPRLVAEEALPPQEQDRDEAPDREVADSLKPKTN